MSRRCLLAVLVAVTCLPGCGLGMRKMGFGPLIGAWTESTSHPEPPHRVALATLEAMRAELASADFARGQDSEFKVVSETMKPGMKPPRPGEPVPPDSPAFWVDYSPRGDGPKQRSLVILVQAHFEGKTHEGRMVQVDVLLEARPAGEDRDGRPVQVDLELESGVDRAGRPFKVEVPGRVGSLVTVKAGRHGDAKLGHLLGERISERLVHPLHPPGSPEEAETLRAFFGGVESREAIPSLHEPARGSPG